MIETESPSAPRNTALVVGGVLALAAAAQFYKGRGIAAGTLFGFAGLLVAIAFLAPRAARIFHRRWMQVAEVLGYVNTRVLLSAIYWLVFTPIGLLLRLTGHDPLTRRGASLDSYWTPRAETRQSRERFERAF